MKRNDTEKLAYKLMKLHGLIDAGWTFKFDRAIRRSGCCHWDKRMITLSGPLSESAELFLVQNTILHEIAHALCPRNVGHGKIWKEKAISIGCTGQRSTTGYSRIYKSRNSGTKFWIGVCDACGHRTNQRSRRNKLSCGRCDRHFNPNFLLRWELATRTYNWPVATVKIGNQKLEVNNVQVQFTEDKS